MLFHITATHSEDNCPGYNLELIPGVLKGLEAREEVARRNNIKIVGLWSGAPDHVFYLVLEGNRTHDIDQFLTEATPFKQAYRLTPVMTADELAELGKAMMASA